MSNYTWYVEPIGGLTNETISNELPPEDALREKTCADNETHDLWRCNHEFITKLKNSQQRLKFNVWVQEGNGQIRIWVPPPKKATKMKRASQLVNKTQA